MLPQSRSFGHRRAASLNTPMMAGFADPAPIRSNLRLTERAELAVPGQLRWSSHHDTVACEVLDFSVKGARIRLPLANDGSGCRYAHLPRDVALIVDGRTEVRCRVVWKIDEQAGLRFSSPPRQLS